MPNSTQQSIDIAGIKDGVIIMKDGSYRILLQVNALNFALKSEMEQNSLIMQYQSFLNSLHFPIQIVIRSRRLDLTPYLARLKKISEKQTNELTKIQTTDYIDFVGQLINMANIMKKTFYVVVSWNNVATKNVSFLDSLFGRKKSETFDHLKISETDFQNNLTKLRERAGIVASGLGGIGLHVKQLSTEDAIELFYQVYNPTESAKERVTDAESLSAPIIVSKSEAKSEDGATQTVTTPSEMPIIDNTEIVKNQQKQEAEARKVEKEKEEERDLRQPDESGEPMAEPKTEAPAAAMPTTGVTAKQAPTPAPSDRTNAAMPTMMPSPEIPDQPANLPTNQTGINT